MDHSYKTNDSQLKLGKKRLIVWTQKFKTESYKWRGKTERLSKPSRCSLGLKKKT
jgi:hypothetical protein